MVLGVRLFHSNACKIAKVKRSQFCRMFDTIFVYIDGSTTRMRFAEPVGVLKYPIVFEDLTVDEDKRAWISRRQRKEKFEGQASEGNVKLDRKRYLKHFKK